MTNNEATIFYSWQSDSSKTRSYIEKCLKGAINNISSDPSLEVSPRVDKDTQGLTGAVEIAKTILEKIDGSDIFLADVSIVDESQGRHLVNQNVLFELGYAVARLGNENIILVANEDLGNLKNLPFDIRGRRIAKFSIDTDLKGNQFTKDLQSIIESHIAVLSAKRNMEESESLQQTLVTAIEDGKPTRSKAEKYFSYR